MQLPDFFRQYVRSQLPPLRVRPEREAAIIEELAQQLASTCDEAIASGVPEDEALRQAKRSIRDWEDLARRIQDAEMAAPSELPQAADGWWFRGLWHDVRFATRILGNAPGFTAFCVLTLALGIGGCAAVFSLLDAIVLRPIEYRNPDQLMIVWERNFIRGNKENVVSPANYLDWRARTNLFTSMSAVGGTRRTLSGAGEPEEVDIQLVQRDFFPLLGVQPILGRALTEEDDKPGAPRVVILSHALWTRKLNADPAIIGRSLNLGGAPYEVVGILPANFLSLGKPADLYGAMQLDTSLRYRDMSGRFLRVVGRLRDGVTRERAQRDLAALAKQLEAEFPAFNKGWGVNLVPLQDHFSSEVRGALWILMGAVGMVLLIACANVANLLLARSVQREREVAIRSSLGASRFRMIRQLFTETLLLALSGAAAGCALAHAILLAFQRFGPVSVPRLESATLDLRVLGITLAISILTAIISGLAPALVSTRVDLTSALKDGSRGIAGGGRRHAILHSIVVAEVALAVILLCGAGLLLRSFQQILAVNPGFDPSRVLTMSIGLSNVRYRGDAAVTNYFRNLNAKIRELPGVTAASSITFLPFTGLASATSFRVDGRPEPAAGQSPTTEVRIVQPRYFEAMRIPVRQGRDFTDADAQDATPLRFIVNDTLAATMFPGQNPIGQRLVVNMQRENKPGEIIGVVGDTKHYGLQIPTRSMVYYPQGKLTFGFASIVIRTEQQDPMQLAPAVIAIIRGLDPEQAVSDVRTMDSWLERSLATQRFVMSLLAAFAGLALLLAVIGIYSVLSFAVTQRTHEIGVRLALGALPWEVRWWIVRHGLVLTGIGLVLGLAGAAMTNALLRSMAFGVELRDPMILGIAALILAFAGAAATDIPARRATRVDPMEALRYE